MDRIQRAVRGLSGLAGMEKREVAQMSTVQIYGADMSFLNEIPFRCVQDAKPGLIYQEQDGRQARCA